MRRSMGRRGNIGNTGGGPLITGHLKDIDLELELLKRKREMIEQQHLLVMEQQFKSSRHYDSYDQMRYDEPVQHGSNRDFTQLYDSGLTNRNQFGRKRQPEVQWQYEGSSKRTHAKKKNNQSQFNQQGQGNIGPANIRNQRPVPGPKSSPKGPAPLMDIKVKPSVGQKIANQKLSQKPSNREFPLIKTTFKPKAPPAPNKLASHPNAGRRSLAAAVAKESGVVLRMLLPDRVPTQKVSGRLELALGAIMKNIRGLIPSDSPHSAAIRSVQLQRVMKQAVRERIRTVMLGKVVGSLEEILAIYREEFPEATDIDIVNIALEAGGATGLQGLPAKEREEKEKPKVVESVAAEAESFKRDMNLLLKAKLHEMFDKLHEIYGSTPAQTELNSGTPEDQNDPQINGEIKKFQEDSSDVQEFLNTDIKVRAVKRILPRLIKRCIPYIIKLIDVVPVSQIATERGVTFRASQKAETIFSNNVSGEEQGDAEKIVISSEASSEARQAHNLPYYVKIMGRPTLPKKKVMHTFLGQFNPKSIKKHRTIHNLLFVGFTEKTDFDAMVGADGTVVGRSTLSVKVCSKGAQDPTNGQNGENNDTNFAMDINPDEIKKENPKDGEIIPADLDFQITDLLSSIRKSEEEEANDTVQETGEEIDNNSMVVKAGVVTEQNEDKSKENKNEQGKEDAQNDEEMENDNADAADSQDNTTETDNKDKIMSNTEETTGDENTAAEEKEVPGEAQSSELANKPETQNSEAINEANVENAEVTNETDKPEVTDNTQTENSTESNNTETNPKVIDNEGTQPSEESPTKTGEPCEGDKVGDLKNNTSGRSTPMRTSARLASVTPSTIRTRRASRLAQN